MSAKSINETSTGRYTATVEDETGGHPSLDALTLTLYDLATSTIINSRNNQNVLNTNNVTYNSSTGLLTWDLQPADNPIINDALEREVHVVEFKGTYNGGKVVRHKFSITVINFTKVS